MINKLLKTLHLLGLALFLGSIITHVFLGIMGDSHADGEARLRQVKMVRDVSQWLTVPGMWLAVITGVMMTVRKKIKPFSVRWLTIHQMLAIAIIVNTTFFIMPLVQGIPTRRLDILGGINVLLILTTVCVGVFKPERRVPWEDREKKKKG